MKDNESQTDTIIYTKLKSLLFNHKISGEDINNNKFPRIISQLLISLETMYNDSCINSTKLKKSNETINIIKRNYEEKIDKINSENSQLKNNIISLNNEKKKMNDETNSYRRQKDSELINCKNKIDALEIRVKQLNEDKDNIEEMIKEYEKHINDIKKDNKIISMNNQSMDYEIKKLKNNLGNNEKYLSKTMNQLNNDNNIFAQFKKQLKKIDTIIDNDLVNINNNNFEYNLNKAKTEGNKFQSMLEDIHNNNNLSNMYETG